MLSEEQSLLRGLMGKSRTFTVNTPQGQKPTPPRHAPILKRPLPLLAPNQRDQVFG